MLITLARPNSCLGYGCDEKVDHLQWEQREWQRWVTEINGITKILLQRQVSTSIYISLTGLNITILVSSCFCTEWKHQSRSRFVNTSRAETIRRSMIKHAETSTAWSSQLLSDWCEYLYCYSTFHYRGLRRLCAVQPPSETPSVLVGNIICSSFKGYLIHKCWTWWRNVFAFESFW